MKLKAKQVFLIGYYEDKKIIKHHPMSQKKPKPVRQTMWAYFAPDGYVQVRSLADTKSLSRDMVAMHEEYNWKDYEDKGYYCQQVDVTIIPMNTVKEFINEPKKV